MKQSSGTSVVLILGGVRSGKSRYAQQLANQSSRVLFVATAERRDDEEMRQKIYRHRAERPAHWTTIEEPLALSRIVRSPGHDCDTILIDCLTLFSANLLESCGDDTVSMQLQVDELCAALKTSPCSIILVSNELGSGVVPAYALGRRFRDLVGEMNQRVAAVADMVVLMVAGLPLPLKGSIDGGQR